MCTTVFLLSVGGARGQLAGAAADPPLVPGELAWRAALEAPLAFAPVTSDDLVVVPLTSGVLVALSLADGKLVWSVTQPTSVGLAIDAAMIFAVHDTTMTARHVETGEIVWSQTMAHAVVAPPGARGGWLLALDAGGGLSAFRASDGEVVWQRALAGTPSQDAPTIDGETVIVGRTSGDLHALSIRTGDSLWHVSVDGRPGMPLIADGRVVVGSTDNALYCLDERSGRLIWRWRAGGDIRARPVVDDAHIYYVSLDNSLRAIDRRSGNLRWRKPLASRATTGLRLVSDQLLVSGLTPRIHAHQTADGQRIGDLEVATELLAAPPVVVRRPAPDYLILIAAGRDGVLFAYRPSLSLLTSPLEALPGDPIELIPPESAIIAAASERR